MKRHLAKALALASAVLTTGASLAQAPVVDINDDSSNTASTVSTQAQNTVSELSSSIPSSFELEQRLLALEQIVDSRTESQQRMSMQIVELQNDIDDMRGSIELHNHQLEKLLERQRELFLELDRRFEGMQAQTNQLDSDISNGISSGGTSSTNTASEQEMYQNAVNLILKQKDHDSAIPAFQRFLSQYPDTGLSANAHYWLGQLFYNKQNYDDAKGQFEQVANKFSDSIKRADSLLKLGLIEKSSGNVNAANSFFEQVVNEYPSGTEARLAKQQLAN